MGLAYFPVLEASDNSPTVVDGKCLARVFDKLTILAQQLKVTPLEAFLGGIPDIALEIEIEELWFEPLEALSTVRVLLGYLEQTQNVFGSQEGIISDLLGLKEVLEIAQQRKVRWHLAIDF
jgi:hypothetical protein